MLRNDGSKISIANSIAKYDVDEDMFFVSVLRDITEEKQQREKLKISEERYRSITENIEESLWFAERKNGNLKVVLYTHAIEDITGYSTDEFLNDDKLWIKIIHPDDTETVLVKLKRLYEDKARNSDVIEYRIIHKSGSIVWIENKVNLIRDSKGEIQKIYGLVSDISIHKKAEAELRKSAEDLKILNDAKDRFLSIISHDLRTPFSSILGFTDYLLSAKDVPEEKQQEYIRMIQSSSKSMLSLVNSLLDWTRIQTGRIKFEPERINAKSILDKSLNMLSGAALQKNVNLNSLIENEVFVHADATLLLQVFNNLISNAIKFTKPGGEIKIAAEPQVAKRAFEFRVIDDGVGISEENRDKLFNIDAKFTTPGTSGEKGSGLGLSLVHEIILKHGGEISVESEPGKGSEFIFSIPVSSMNILLVDDMKTDRLLYSKLIKNFLPGYNIVEASEGEEALESIKISPPAIVITDHLMPKMNGYDLVKNIKMLETKFKPPVIILSSDVTEIVEEEYRELGIEYVFQKPVNLKSFKEALEKSLKKAIYN
ncbi:MAG: ATP-binding protein [Melioribacteraceae bacterium]|nr:ATP-binding protein [Melioribacteraceae bacterium]